MPTNNDFRQVRKIIHFSRKLLTYKTALILIKLINSDYLQFLLLVRNWIYKSTKNHKNIRSTFKPLPVGDSYSCSYLCPSVCRLFLSVLISCICKNTYLVWSYKWSWELVASENCRITWISTYLIKTLLHIHTIFQRIFGCIFLLPIKLFKKRNKNNSYILITFTSFNSFVSLRTIPVSRELYQNAKKYQQNSFQIRIKTRCDDFSANKIKHCVRETFATQLCR